MSRPAPEGSGGYSDTEFDSVCELFEQRLGDLMGIEAASQTFLTFRQQVTLGEYDNVAPSPKALTMPSTSPYTVYPSLPLEAVVGDDGTYQKWLDAAYAAGKQAAAGTGAWLKSLADNYYLVETNALISGATRQGELAHTVGTTIVHDVIEVSGNMFAHWEGEAQEAFGEWFAAASAVVSALMLYADSAQLVAGAAGDAISATQNAMLKQVKGGSDTLDAAVSTWHEDFDVFPDPPGSGWTLDQIGTAISHEIDQYTSQLPKPAELVVDAVIAKGVSKIPYAGQVIGAYNVLVALDTDTDPKKPKSADEILKDTEQGLRDLANQGDLAISKLADGIAAIRAQVDSDKDLVLPRLPRDPSGHYDPYEN